MLVLPGSLLSASDNLPAAVTADDGLAARVQTPFVGLQASRIVPYFLFFLVRAAHGAKGYFSQQGRLPWLVRLLVSIAEIPGRLGGTDSVLLLKVALPSTVPCSQGSVPARRIQVTARSLDLTPKSRTILAFPEVPVICSLPVPTLERLVWVRAAGASR